MAVTVAVPPFSARGLPLTARVTVGGASSSVRVAVTCCVPLSVPLLTLAISTITVSSTSSRASSTPVRVTEPEVLPAVMVMLAALRV